MMAKTASPAVDLLLTRNLGVPPTAGAESDQGAPAPASRLLSYELGAPLGAGGMGAVYRATHTWLRRPVAIKFLANELLRDDDALARFRREAAAVGRLDHENVVRALDAGQSDGRCFLVTELVDGVDLETLVEQRGALPLADACEIVRQAALGLQHAHERGLVHRDIKPSNLMLDNHGRVKVLDFGLARIASGHTTLTTAGLVMGTLDFLAPEQAENLHEVDIRCDLYSLGCTFYYLLAGRPPFDGPDYETPAAKLKAHLIDWPEPIETYRAGVPRAVAACLERMLAKDPDDRYALPAQVAGALAPYARHAQLGRLQAGTTPRRPAVAGVMPAMSWLARMVLPRRRRRTAWKASAGESSATGSLGAFVGLFLLAMVVCLFFTGSCEFVELPADQIPPEFRSHDNLGGFQFQLGH